MFLNDSVVEAQNQAKILIPFLVKVREYKSHLNVIAMPETFQ